MKSFFIGCLCLFITSQLTAQDYNKLDPEYTSLAKDAISKLSEANRQWFTEKSKEHPAGNFDAAWTKTQLTQKFTAEQASSLSDIMVLMMAYLKSVSKEAREDAKLNREQKNKELEIKNAKLAADNKSIDAGMKEAGQKADVAMTAANTSLATGTASGTIQAAGAVSSSAGNNNTNTVTKKVEDDPKTKSLLKLRSQLSDLGKLK